MDNVVEVVLDTMALQEMMELMVEHNWLVVLGHLVVVLSVHQEIWAWEVQECLVQYGEIIAAEAAEAVTMVVAVVVFAVAATEEVAEVIMLTLQLQALLIHKELDQETA